MNRWSWEALRLFDLLLAAGTGTFAILDGPSWTAMVQAFVAGFALASASWCSHAIQQQRRFDRMFRVMEALQRENTELCQKVYDCDGQP